MPHTPSRRTILAWAALAALPATTLTAMDFDELDPTDTVPRRFSVESFTELSEAEVYMVNLAIRRGRRILIDGYTPSESREIINRAAQDWPATRSWLLSGGRTNGAG